MGGMVKWGSWEGVNGRICKDEDRVQRNQQEMMKPGVSNSWSGYPSI